MKKMIVLLISAFLMSAVCAEEVKKVTPMDFLSNMQVKLGYSYLNPTDNDLNDIAFHGFDLSVGYNFNLPSGVEATTELTYGFGYDKKEEGKMDQDMYLNLIMLNQSFGSDFKTSFVTINPFITLGLGWGFGRTNVETDGVDAVATMKGNAFAYELGAGANFKTDFGLMPFVKFSYLNFEMDEMKTRPNKDANYTTVELKDGDEIDLRGFRLVAGIGYRF